MLLLIPLRLVPLVCALPLLLAAARAQSLSMPASLQPDSQELGGLMQCPLMYGAARLQQLYEASETGATTFVVHRLELRFDGPAAGPKAQHSIANLRIAIGATARGVAAAGATFADNLTAKLTQALAVQSYSFTTDTSSVPGPEPWGGSGALLFQLATPVSVVVPQGGCFAVEITCDGNSNTAADIAALDFHLDPAVQPGIAVDHGRGCASNATSSGATLLTAGQYAPGTAFSVFGDAYAPKTPVVTVMTAKLFANPVALPGTTPVCWVYVDLDTGLPVLMQAADGGGQIQSFGGGSMVPLPKSPTFCGAVLYLQNAAPTPLWTGNAFGLLSSNYRTVTLGCAGSPAVHGWFAANHVSASATQATFAAYGGLAMRVQ